MSGITKKLIVAAVVFIFFAMGTAFAQEPDVETKLQETKESINELVEAKDENSPFGVSIRVKTFKKAVDLALTEVKDLKISLIALEIENERLKEWREKIIEELNNIINYYEEKLDFVSENEDSFTLEKIRQEAENLKTWREENYFPLQNQIHDFLLIKKEDKALQISNRRAGKISNDLEILDKAGFKELKKISNLFKEADVSIKDAQKENERALNLFIEKYTSPATSTSPVASVTTTTSTSATASTTTSTISNTTSTKAASTTLKITSSTETTSTAQTFSIQSTSTAESDDSPGEKQDESIRGLVSSSWKKIKSAYQIFIEMSGFVRKSLQ